MKGVSPGHKSNLYSHAVNYNDFGGLGGGPFKETERVKFLQLFEDIKLMLLWDDFYILEGVGCEECFNFILAFKSWCSDC